MTQDSREPYPGFLLGIHKFHVCNNFMEYNSGELTVLKDEAKDVQDLHTKDYKTLL